MIELKEDQVWESNITGERRRIIVYETHLKDLGGDEIEFESTVTQRGRMLKHGKLSRYRLPSKRITVPRRLFVSWMRRHEAELV